MPYQIFEVDPDPSDSEKKYKVGEKGEKMSNNRYYLSNKPLTYEQAKRQMVAVIISEH